MNNNKNRYGKKHQITYMFRAWEWFGRYSPFTYKFGRVFKYGTLSHHAMGTPYKTNMRIKQLGISFPGTPRPCRGSGILVEFRKKSIFVHGENKIHIPSHVVRLCFSRKKWSF